METSPWPVAQNADAQISADVNPTSAVSVGVAAHSPFPIQGDHIVNTRNTYLLIESTLVLGLIIAVIFILTSAGVL